MTTTAPVRKVHNVPLVAPKPIPIEEPERLLPSPDPERLIPYVKKPTRIPVTVPVRR